MKLTLDQNTDEWREYRRYKIGGSDCAKIMGECPYTTEYELFHQKVYGTSVPMNPAMQRGVEREPVLRKWFEEKEGVQLPATVFQSDLYSFMIASVDGVCDEFFVEIKTCGKDAFEKVKNGDVPRNWLWQLQHNFVVTELPKAALIVECGEERHVLWASPVDFLMERLISHEKRFYECLLTQTPPEMTERDWVVRKDEDWLKAASAYREAKEALRICEALEKKAKERLIELANGLSTKGAGVQLSRYWRKGVVQYDEIPELDGVDLDAYRKEGCYIWRPSLNEPDQA